MEDEKNILVVLVGTDLTSYHGDIKKRAKYL